MIAGQGIGMSLIIRRTITHLWWRFHSHSWMIILLMVVRRGVKDDSVFEGVGSLLKHT